MSPRAKGLNMTMSRSGTFEFTLILEGADVLDDAAADALFEAGLDDATLGEIDGSQFADFTRTASSFAEAVVDAIAAIESAVSGVKVVRVEPDDLVTAGEIADRTGRSRESVRLLISGDRGPGRFPQAVSHLKSRARLWRWADVVGWFRNALGEDVPAAAQADFLAALNGALEIRYLAPRLSEPDEREHLARFVREDAEILGEYGKPWPDSGTRA